MNKEKTFDLRDRQFEERSTRTITVFYDSEIKITTGEDGRRYKQVVPIGERRVVNISPLCTLHDEEIAWGYGGFIIRDRDLKPQLASKHTTPAAVASVERKKKKPYHKGRTQNN